MFDGDVLRTLPTLLQSIRGDFIRALSAGPGLRDCCCLLALAASWRIQHLRGGAILWTCVSFPTDYNLTQTQRRSFFDRS